MTNNRRPDKASATSDKDFHRYALEMNIKNEGKTSCNNETGDKDKHV
ncbi:uncharacterized protein Asalp_32660 [Aeromonas salmonicida subsp. pectinolytica 34mel]|uniref:Uncharacterized protein n=1 Tax=Aeromonas salmonicida subsp. pectinolytica 34mel TaxID=1324960 RepID=A0A2D1QJE7_AERSA|nr:uncharacterized protein Asalp_32660 [Aeromonas salmonicida subsp. pectinolytica 34mel]